MSTALKRLSKELREASLNPDSDMDLHLLHAGSLFTWEAVLRGPPDTPFEGGEYRLLLRIPQDYPMLPPTANFVTKVFHPNVNFDTGAVCLDILKSRWSPAWTLNSVCRAILNLLAEPEPDSPYNCDAGNLLRAGDMEGYASLVRMYAIMDAGAPLFPELA
ncbi:putative ubiquitin-conjugating enzyme E2 [Trypanosoma cruzi]|uniref:Ubiquitin-conjugating enzyme E2, putative n=2 Tax=Trypanosoma cruzi TaxID=5693 RepID=Q4DHI7_TRYCC|nr:ubiquitin-conjugating enzyme E2, putative [Trypanosoma cruzi]EAN91983.1 ubiquitin-conjugating enzyme E2, putative [Trypanosoma cruzi]PWV18052.1 putative ubiquitin-conjugating enzyme E2 [Trypanosoma cruzi]RNC59854.1 ubiquitin-conjugating enzyme E2 [Trypanosoma cruzi]|eukprot:XP_813834.1 ubiquitin-conjugating enzyme E2 [Trypanosoma cruzi strain CL Brener]